MPLKDQYLKLKKKHKHLPDWNWLSENFRIKHEEDAPVLENARASATEKLENILRGIIEPLLSGNENFCCFFERKFISQAEKDELFEIYKNLQALLWRSHELQISFSEKAAVEWLADLKTSWTKFSPKLQHFTKKISHGWENYKKTEVETAYHG